ncbi:MAG: hypoxanthine phosphoribosyltransferase [Chitinophagales bacterium]|nr:hypoxanthine phosphoribosyltransferase [Chitinophagales bacterium]
MVTIQDKQFRPFIEHKDIDTRIALMAERINEDYRGKDVLFLSILTGSFMFTGDLMKYIKLDCEIAFARLASYKGTQSTGIVRSLMGFDENVNGRHIILLEDIVDSGHTLYNLLPELNKLEPASIAIAALLIKPNAMRYPIQVDYHAFSISNEFIVGYGLDYNGYGRNLRDIYQVC